MPLYLIPTPVGNLEDITLRALRLLKEADIILAEDTRQTAKLLHHYQIENKVQSFHQHNEHQQTPRIIGLLQTGQIVAMVTDAGTPGISDPGFLLVRACHQAQVKVHCLPGATAFVPALVQSGFPSDRFCFEGFLPHKKGRQKKWQMLANEPRTIVLYESPYRLIKALDEIAKYFDSTRKVAVCRELTKLFEETRIGTPTELKKHYETNGVKGEVVIVIQGISDLNEVPDEDEHRIQNH